MVIRKFTALRVDQKNIQLRIIFFINLGTFYNNNKLNIL